MRRSTKLALMTGFAALAGTTLAPGAAHAYSVKVHIHFANEIRDELVRNMSGQGCTAADAWCGKPAIRLLGPDGDTKFVVLDRKDAEAIRDNPEFWRGGAIGPDNTVFPGMTDPSHAWHFSPFSQCQAMLDNSTTGAERAYALGCYLHGITDNNVHHVVNYFSGETFTLFPKDAADDELKFSLLNVVRHMTVEGKIEKALENAKPGAFSADKMKHRIAKDLYRRVYLDPDTERGLWHWFAGQLVARKNDALMAAQLDGFDPQDHLELSIEEIKEEGRAIELDGRVMQAYVDFLETGGTVDGLTPGSLAPHDYVLLLPEIVEDVKRLLDITEAAGVAKLAEHRAEWNAEGCNTLLCPVLKTKIEFYEHLFAPRNGQRSRFGEAVDLKKRQLDGVLDGYIGTVERLSNLIVSKGIPGIGRDDLKFAMQPLADAIDQVTDFPYEVMFPQWAVDVVERVAPLKQFLQGAFRLVTEEFKAQIVARMTQYTDQLKAQLLAMSPQAVQDIHAKAKELAEIAKAQVDQTKLAALGIDLRDADAALASFDTSVLYMNSYNSIAGALANQAVVFSTAPTSFFGGGPVSFDASYQVAYNQLSVCDGLREAFYPCGTSAIESLQGDFRACEALDLVTPEMEPPAECHDGSAVEFVDDPNPAQCVRRHLEEIVDFHEGHLGSYSLAIPPSLADRGPECVNPQIPGLVLTGDKDDDASEGSEPAVGDEAGCACTAGESDGAGWGAALLLLLGVPAIRRRRR